MKFQSLLDWNPYNPSSLFKILAILWTVLSKNTHHINQPTSIIFATLKDIRAIRYHLDKDTTKIFMQAMVMSKLDCCNSLLVGSVEYQLDKLQCIQNTACRMCAHYPNMTISQDTWLTSIGCKYMNMSSTNLLS